MISEGRLVVSVSVAECTPRHAADIFVTTCFAYGNGSRVLNQPQNAVTNSVSSVLSVVMNTYALHGELLFSALDVNHSGVIDFAGPDRVTGQTSAFITKDNSLWREDTQTVYPDFDSVRAVTTAKSRHSCSPNSEAAFRDRL